MEMTVVWNYRLVALSVVIAIIGSYVALDFANRMRESTIKHKILLFIIGALSMGLAIWMMHFIGMLAMHTSMLVSYDKVLSALSILAATIGSGIAFAIMRRKNICLIHLVTGGIAMGIAISTMHYIGMASMKMGAVIYYTPFLFVLSIVIAIVASVGALWISFYLRTVDVNALFYKKIGGAVVMGLAISSMHYIGMAAAHYRMMAGSSSAMIPSTVGGITVSDLLMMASIIFGIILVILSFWSDVEFQTVKELNTQINHLASRYQSLISHAKEAIISINSQGIITLWNPSAECLFGYSETDALGKNIANLIIPSEYQSRLQKGIEHMLSTGEAPFLNQTIEITARRRNEEIFPIEISLFQSGLKEQREYTSIIRDISERKKLETDLKNSEEIKRLMVDSIKDYAIFLLDSEGIVTSWNTGAQRISGYRAEDIIGKHFSIFYMPEAIQKKHPQYELKTALEQGEYVEQGWRVRKNNSIFWANVTITPVYRNNQLIGFSKIVQDLTEQKKSQEQVEATIEELESFSYTVSHDLRAPLRSIDGFSKILLERYTDMLDEQGQHFLKRIRDGSQQMGQLIDDILNLSRLTRTQLIIDKKLDLTLMAKNIITEFQRLEPDRQVVVNIEEGIIGEGDKHLLHIALQNLLANAWKFTSHHAVAHITFKTMLQAGKTVYYVKDDGAGFDMAYVKKLFGAFQRLHQANEFPGTGIGLATVQRIIKRHLGTIWAEGAVEKGAVFYFTLGKMGA